MTDQSESKSNGPFATALVIILLYLLVLLSMFWPVVLNPLLLLQPTFSPFSDAMVIHWPKAYLMAQHWQSGQGLPYWTPLILSGMPLAANQLAMLFYPPAWLFLLLPVALTFNILLLFHLLLGGLGMVVLLRAGLQLPFSAAIVGGLAFMLNSKWIAHAAGGHVSMVGAVGWMPWVIVGATMLLSHLNAAPNWPKTLFWGLVTVLALTMQVVTHTLPLIYSVYLMGAIALFYGLVIRPRSVSGRTTVTTPQFLALSLTAMALIISLAALLGASQLLPLLELANFSNRSLSLAQATDYSVSVTQLLIGLLLPSAQGGHELVIYLGLVPLLLVPLGLSRQHYWGWFYMGLLVFVLLFSLGPVTPLHQLFYTFAPGFRWVRTPARIFLVGAIAVSVLSGLATMRLQSIRWSATAKRWAIRLAVAGGALALMLGLGLAIGFGQLGRASLGLALFVPATLAIIALRINRMVSARLATLLLGLILFLDLVSFNTTMLRFVPPAQALAPGQTAAEYLSQRPGLFRIYSPSYSLPMQTAAAHHLRLADGVEPVHLESYDHYMAQAGGYHDASFSVTIPPFGDRPVATALKDTEPNLRLLGLLNVEILAAAFPMEWPGLVLEKELEGTFIYSNSYGQPLARVVHNSIPVQTNWLEQLTTLPDLANTVLVAPNAPLPQSNRAASAARVTLYSADRIALEADLVEAGWLVLSEIHYPGWQATVNGLPQQIWPVNGLFRGIYLDRPGQYQIELRYRPAGVVWGKRITGITLLSLVVAGAASWRYASAAGKVK